MLDFFKRLHVNVKVLTAQPSKNTKEEVTDEQLNEMYDDFMREES